MDSYSKAYYEIETSKANRQVWLNTFVKDWLSNELNLMEWVADKSIEELRSVYGQLQRCYLSTHRRDDAKYFNSLVAEDTATDTLALSKAESLTIKALIVTTRYMMWDEYTGKLTDTLSEIGLYP